MWYDTKWLYLSDIKTPEVNVINTRRSIGMNESRIARINELYHKSKAEGLTAAEKEEQAKLRAEYLTAIRANIRGQLNNIDMVNKDGTIENLGEKYGKNYKHTN